MMFDNTSGHLRKDLRIIVLRVAGFGGLFIANEHIDLGHMIYQMTTLL